MNLGPDPHPRHHLCLLCLRLRHLCTHCSHPHPHHLHLHPCILCFCLCVPHLRLHLHVCPRYSLRLVPCSFWSIDSGCLSCCCSGHLILHWDEKRWHSPLCLSFERSEERRVGKA